MIRTFEPQSQEWLEARTQYITGTEIASVFGLDPWKSWKKMLKDKTIPPQKIDNPAMRAGRLLEPSVFVALNEVGIPAQPAHLSKVVMAIDEVNHISASMDGKMQTKEGFYIIECKSTKMEKFNDWYTKVPLKYSLQVQVQMLVSGVDKALIACLGGLYPDLPLIVYEIRPDKVLHDIIRSECRRIWNAFEADYKDPKFTIDKKHKEYILKSIDSFNKLIVSS